MKMHVKGHSETGHTYNLAPVRPSGLTARGAIDTLKYGLPVGWVMEPGDATRYRIIIIPLWFAKDVRLAAADGGIGTGNRWFLLVKPGDGNALVMPGCGPWDLVGKDRLTRNGWTARMVSALVRMIWHLIDHPEVDPNEYVYEEEEQYAV